MEVGSRIDNHAAVATLSSSSTDDEVRAAYDDNASYEEDASASKCRSFITACKLLLRRRPSSVSNSGMTTAFNDGAVEAELDRARTWLAGNSTARAGGVKYFDFSDLRS